MFYVLLALRARLRADGAFALRPEPNLGALLDLVALGTVADVVRLDRVNRIFVEQGIARIRNGRAQPGVAALFTVAARDPRRATAYDLGFVAGPRLNAAGRLADMSLGIRCLLAETASEALALAGELDRLNRERREVEEAMRLEAFADIESAAQAPAADAFTLCVYRPEWHQGVIGIVASRLKDRFHRPAIVFARGVDGELKGSGRSIEGFHLRDGLDLVAKRAPGIVRRFGGHAFAAGVSIDEAALSAFAAAFEDVARERLTPALLRRTLETDGTLGPGELTFDFANVLRDRVWGQGFPVPVFDDRFVVRGQRLVGGRHMQLSLERSGEQFDGIAFAQSEPLPPRVHAAYRLDIHEWNGLQSLQLVIEHWLPAERN
jgi:single-stranded-DNA-specific exonuclease